MLEAWVLCMALNVHFEARGEPIDGQFMVAIATWNRAQWKPEKVCEVVYAPKQFSWTIKRPPLPKETDPEFQHAVKIAQLSVHMRDFTGGVDHYHRHDVRPDWSGWTKLEIAGRYGDHITYRPRRVQK